MVIALKVPEHVHRHDPKELLFGHLQKPLPHVDSRCRDEHIGGAEVVEERVDRGCVADINSCGRRSSPSIHDLVAHPVGALFGEIGAENIGTVGGQSQSAGLTDTTSGPDDNNPLALEAEQTSVRLQTRHMASLCIAWATAETFAALTATCAPL